MKIISHLSFSYLFYIELLIKDFITPQMTRQVVVDILTTPAQCTLFPPERRIHSLPTLYWIGLFFYQRWHFNAVNLSKYRMRISYRVEIPRVVLSDLLYQLNWKDEYTCRFADVRLVSKYQYRSIESTFWIIMFCITWFYKPVCYFICINIWFESNLVYWCLLQVERFVCRSGCPISVV